VGVLAVLEEGVVEGEGGGFPGLVAGEFFDAGAGAVGALAVVVEVGAVVLHVKLAGGGVEIFDLDFAVARRTLRGFEFGVDGEIDVGVAVGVELGAATLGAADGGGCVAAIGAVEGLEAVAGVDGGEGDFDGFGWVGGNVLFAIAAEEQRDEE